jgi:hypothetical protein
MSTESTIQLPTSDQDTASHCSTARATACRTIHDFIAPSQILACTPSSIKLLIGSDTRLLDPGYSELCERPVSNTGRCSRRLCRTGPGRSATCTLGGSFGELAVPAAAVHRRRSYDRVPQCEGRDEGVGSRREGRFTDDLEGQVGSPGASQPQALL